MGLSLAEEGRRRCSLGKEGVAVGAVSSTTCGDCPATRHQPHGLRVSSMLLYLLYLETALPQKQTSFN